MELESGAGVRVAVCGGARFGANNLLRRFEGDHAFAAYPKIETRLRPDDAEVCRLAADRNYRNSGNAAGSVPVQIQHQGTVCFADRRYSGARRSLPGSESFARLPATGAAVPDADAGVPSQFR